MIAHLGGVPVEELLPAAPAAGASLLMWIKLRVKGRA